MKKKINLSFALCEMTLIMQLLWMQKKVFFPNIDGFLYNILYYMKYIVTIIVIVYSLMIKREEKDKEISKKYVYIFIPLIILIILIQIIASLDSPISELYGIKYWTRFLTYFLDKIFIIIFAVCISYICKKNTIKCISNSLLIDGFLIVTMVVIKYGFGEIFNAFMAILGIYPENPAMKILEVHELTYCIGLCLIYYLFFSKGEKKKDMIRIILLSIIFVLGGKRIAFAGIIVSGMISIIIHRKELTSKSIIAIGLIGIIICYCYIAILYNGSFMSAMTEHNINVMGRDLIYQYFIKRTELSIDYHGWGFASVSKVIETMSRSEVQNMINVRGLHNDILKIYIECGFIFFFFWLFINMIYITLQILKKIGKKEATFYITLIIFAFITYLTDNTENYFVFQIILCASPLAMKMINEE